MAIDRPEHRWLFIRKVYTILSIQLLVTTAVAALVVTVHPISHFIATTRAGLVVYIIIIITTFVVLLLQYFFYQMHPLNYILLGVFTVSLAFSVGLACSYTKGKVILEAVILTAALVVSLTLYTFWAVKRGHDFSFLRPFLFGALVILLVFALIQVFHPFGKIGVMIYSCVASIIFCGYIVYDTNNLIKQYSYDDYIWAALALYLDVINLFLALLDIMKNVD